MDRMEDLLRRIREPRACVELLLAAPGASTGQVAQQLAAVLSCLPAVHAELGASPGRTPAVEELVRRVGGLELLLLELACHVKEPAHGIVRRDDRSPHSAAVSRLRDVGWVAGDQTSVSRLAGENAGR
jgi:hypothetical protein